MHIAPYCSWDSNETYWLLKIYFMERNYTDDKWPCYMIWAIGFVLLVMIVSFFVIYKCIDCWEHRGQFGDLFGVVNALFSGLAFAGLIITIRQQHLDLEYQSQSIAQTKQELENQQGSLMSRMKR